MKIFFHLFNIIFSLGCLISSQPLLAVNYIDKVDILNIDKNLTISSFTINNTLSANNLKWLDRDLIISSNFDGYLFIYNVTTGENIRTICCHENLNKLIKLNNNKVATLNATEVKILEISTGSILRTIKDNEISFKDLTCMTENLIAIGGTIDSKGTIKIYRIDTGEKINEFSSECKITSIVWFAKPVNLVERLDDNLIAAGTSDNRVRVFDISNGKCVDLFSSGESISNLLAITSDKILIINPSGIFFYNLSTKLGQSRYSYSFKSFDKLNATSYIISDNNDLRIFDTDSGNLMQTFSFAPKNISETFVISSIAVYSDEPKKMSLLLVVLIILGSILVLIALGIIIKASLVNKKQRQTDVLLN